MFKVLRKIILAAVFLMGMSLAAPQPAAAVNLFGDTFSPNVGSNALNAIGLGRRDPRAIAASVINIALGILGVLAVILILYAGFLWMNSAGDPEKIDKARKILISAAIGLLIILSAWAISLYVINRLLYATGARSTSPGSACTQEGATAPCGCGGVRVCAAGVWGACEGSDCTGGGTRRACDSNTLTTECEADASACSADEFCDTADCRCSPKGGYGQSCDANTVNSSCEVDNNFCREYLTCDPTECKCLGEPVIESVSPTGGFCDGSTNTACVSDADCAQFNPGTCAKSANLETPNAAAGNLLTLSGRYFQTYQAGVSKVLFWGGSGFTVEAALADSVNSNCRSSWSDSQIIVVVPTGAASGALQVVAANGADTTNNNRGPALKDLLINNLARPGLCNLEPARGPLDTALTYSGLGLAGVTAYFGAVHQAVAANNSSFAGQTSGTATVPNLRAGTTSSFVRAASGAISNGLVFMMENEAVRAPVIIGFEPASGPAGQYVTIRGSGFGNARGLVYFGEREADFNFPAVCAKSVWRDNEIIVKVPTGLSDGSYKIKVEVKQLTTESSDVFQVLAAAPLYPGLCKLEPLFGRVNDEIKLWGENFGALNNFSRVRFSANKERRLGAKLCLGGKNDGASCTTNSNCDSNKCEEEISYWGRDPSSSRAVKADTVTTRVPLEAISGAVQVIKEQANLTSNGLNFTVGQCIFDQQCGEGAVCCPSGTPSAGRCQDNASECYGQAAACVYEWQFDTGGQQACPPDRPNACQDGSCCRSQCVLNSASGLTTCLDDDSCSGYGASQCLDNILCPNSPGNCSQNNQLTITGSTCNCQLLGCTDCQFDAALNRCLSPKTCSLKQSFTDERGRKFEKSCVAINGEGRWQVRTKQTCPTGFTRQATGTDICLDLVSSCQLCSGGLSCLAANGQGICGLQRAICPNNFSCQDNVCQRQGGSCECCCDKKQNQADGTNEACCAPLTCANSCGSGGDFGLCSGCAAVGTTQAEHDAACNCTGTSGKFCDASVAGGVCRDCGQLGAASDCSQHLACCVDYQQGNACRGVKDARWLEGATAYCAYYNCGDDCTAPAKEGAYKTQSNCLENCPPGGDETINCDGKEEAGCQRSAAKCPKDKPVCNEECICEAELPIAGDTCRGALGACSLFCGTAYFCRGEAGCEGLGCAGAPDENTCRCCCNPNNKSSDPSVSDFDKCKKIGSGKLFCQANVAPCSGDQRGLCCGCQGDESCGDPANVGCSADTCCRPRPKVETVLPANGATAVCRNSLIRATFDRPMEQGSFSGNVIVVGDYGDGLCPDNTTLLALTTVESTSFLAKTWQKISQWLSQIWSKLSGRTVSAAGSNFCAISGQVVGGQFYDSFTEKTYLDFQLASALSPNIQYYVIIKGDAALNSKSGVLDINKIGLYGANQTAVASFNGLTYPNAYIWSFRAGTDICRLGSVLVDPEQHLFQKPNVSYPFSAQTISPNGQIIVSLPEYDWSWSWRSDNSAVATVAALAAPADYQATVTSANQKDAQTFVYARATITKDNINPVSTEGSYQEGRARIIVFLCANPWPAVVDPDNWPWRWSDSGSNCDICTDEATGRTRPCTSADCLNNNFELYYCRDQAGVGTKDDLPSLALDPPIRGRYKYRSQDNWVDVLKDFYFFRAPLPAAPANLKAVLTGALAGGEVKLTWTTARDTTYKIYYGTASRQYNIGRDAGTADSLTIGNLKNNTTYYFALTATDVNKVESAYSDEAIIKVEDKVPPAKPVNAAGLIKSPKGAKQIELTWEKNQPDTAQFSVAYGPNPAPAISLKVGLVGRYLVEKINNLATTDYYVQLRALDAYGNQSQPVILLCAKGCADECACQIQ